MGGDPGRQEGGTRARAAGMQESVQGAPLESVLRATQPPFCRVLPNAFHTVLLKD